MALNTDLLTQIFDAIRGRFTLAEIEELLTTDPQRLIYAIRETAEQELSARMVPEIEATIIASGNYNAIIELLPNGAITAPYAFSLATSATAQYISNYVARHVAEISQNTANAIQQTIQRHEQQSLNPRNTARDIRRNIGLTVRQEQAVANYRAMLESGDKEALKRKLRDARFDGTVRRAIETETSLTTAQINRMVQRYRERYIKYRSEVIARTEQLTAVSVGQRQSMKQARDNGVLSSRLRRFWEYMHDSRVRHWHASIPMLNPDGVAIDEKFLTQPPAGAEYLDGPRDPDGSGANIIQCRCRERYKLI